MTGIDEIGAARKKRRRRRRIRRILRLSLAILLLAALVSAIGSVQMTTFPNLGDHISTFFAGGPGYPMLLDSGRPKQLLPLSGAFAVLTDSELIVASNRGGEMLRTAHGYANPAVAGHQSKLVLFNIGNRDFAVYNRTGELFSAKTEQPIHSADAAKNGTAAVLTRGDRTTSELRVYSGGNYALMFTWYGVRGFPQFCEISESGDEALVASLTVTERGNRTVLTAIDIGAGEQRAETEFDGTVLRLFRLGSKYIVLTDSRALTLGASLAVEAEYRFPRMPVLAASMSRGGLLAVAFGDNNQPDVNYVAVLNERMEETAVLRDTGPVRSLVMTEDRVMILSEDEIKAVRSDGSAAETYAADRKAAQIFLAGNRISLLFPDRIEQPGTAKAAE